MKPLSKEEREERVALANRAIEVIASHGRRFFSLAAEGRAVEVNRISRFELRRGRIIFVDKYSQKEIYTSYRMGRWRGFSEGGTLRSLVEALADWIAGKREFPFNHLGPWPQWASGGDVWGYGESSMASVRSEVSALFETCPYRIAVEE